MNALTFLLCAAAAQSSNTTGGHIKQWWPDMTGTTRASTTTITGTKVDAESDLGLAGNTEGVTEFGLWGHFMLPFQVFFTTYGGGFKANRTIPRPFTFEGGTFNAGDIVSSEATFRAYTVVIDTPLGNAGQYGNTMEFGVQLGVQFMSHQIEMTDPLGVRFVDKLLVPIPMAGFRGRIQMGERFELYSLVQYMNTSGIIDAYDVSYLDFTIELRIYIAQGFAFGGGYRLLDFTANTYGSDLDRFDWGVKGWFISLTYMQ